MKAIDLGIVMLSLSAVASLALAQEQPRTPAEARTPTGVARHPDERDGSAKIIHRAEVVPDRSTNGPARGGLWPLYATPEARLNYFEVTGRTSLHFHPDAEHRLYVLEGKVLVTCGTNTTVAVVGDFIVIPRGVRHCYDVPVKGDRAMLLTFDAPPFDPRKTVNLEGAERSK